MFSFRRKSAVHKKGKIKRRVIDPSKRMLLKQLAIGLAIFSLLGVLVVALWYGTRVQMLTISELSVEGGETIPHAKVEELVNQALDGTYIGLIPRRFAWWYPEEEIIAKISEVPRMKNPRVERASGRGLAITFEEYEPYALWCPDREGYNCLFVDKYGYAFGPAPKLQGGAFLRYRTLGRDVVKGGTVAEKADLEKMEKFVDLVDDNLQFPITQIETDTSGDVFYILGGGGELKATLRDDSAKVYDNLRTILASKEFSDVRPGNFQYIDLRFGNKIFVNEEMGESATTTASSSAEAVPTTETDSTVSEEIVEPVPTTVPPMPRPRPAEEELPV